MADDDFIAVECMDTASLLELCGISYDRVDLSVPNRARFFFPNTKEVQSFLKAHYTGRIRARYKSVTFSFIDFAIKRQGLKAKVNGLRGVGAGK